MSLTADFLREIALSPLPCNYASITVSVLLGNGDGTFQDAVSYPVGNDPKAVAIADVRQNGILDLVVADNGSPSVILLLGNGDGTLQPGVSLAAGYGTYGLAAVDLTGDGFPDVVVANDTSPGTVTILLNAADWDGVDPDIPPKNHGLDVSAGIHGEASAEPLSSPFGPTGEDAHSTLAQTASDGNWGALAMPPQRTRMATVDGPEARDPDAALEQWSGTDFELARAGSSARQTLRTWISRRIRLTAPSTALYDAV